MANALASTDEEQRLGPRPLALYLQLASLDASPFMLERFLAGVRAYWAHPFRRRCQQRPVLWRDGSARLMAYADAGRPVLVLPSLINRTDVLDLMPERSLLEHLVAAGFRPLLLDWGKPEGTELRLTLAEQIHGRAHAALDVAITLTGQRPVLLGYCLGGLLAAGLAASRQGDLAGLALLATPWDFHAGEASSVLVAANRLPLASTIATLGCAPVDMLQFFLRCSIRSRSFANTYALPIFGPTTHERAFSWPWKTG